MAVDHSGLETLSLSITVSVSRPIRDWEGESEARYVATYRLTAWLSACLSLPILTIVSVKATPWRRDEHEESCRSVKQSLGAGGLPLPASPSYMQTGHWPLQCAPLRERRYLLKSCQ